VNDVTLYKSYVTVHKITGINFIRNKTPLSLQIEAIPFYYLLINTIPIRTSNNAICFWLIFAQIIYFYMANYSLIFNKKGHELIILRQVA